MMTAPTTALIAYHGDEAIKQRYLDRVRAHRENHPITLRVKIALDRVRAHRETSDHAAYERELEAAPMVAERHSD